MQRNTLVTIADNKIGVSSSNANLADFYEAQVLSATDYYAFGMSMKERTFQSESYRYGFNGKEKDKDIGEETTDFGARLYNGKIGRWMAVDPLAGKYVSLSPYNYVANSPIQAIDPDGRLIIFVNGLRMSSSDGDQGRTDLLNGLLWALQINPGSAAAMAFFRYFTKIGPEVPIEGVWKTDIFGSLPGSPYWSKDENSKGKAVSMDELFMERIGDYNAWYTSGSAERGSQASSRYDDGVKKADEINGMIKSGEIKLEDGESIKIVAHSQGCAHAAGMAA